MLNLKWLFTRILNSHGHLEISFPLRSSIGRYPWLYYPIYNLVPKNSKLAVAPDTELVIEGFPRSANTFAVLAFKSSQSNTFKIAHHMHVPAQIIRAAHFKIPTIVLIRNPTDAVISLNIRDPKISLDQALKCYISFYERIYPYKAGFVLASFEEITNGYSGVIEQVNKRFSTNYIAATPTDRDLENIFRQADSLEEGVESKVSRPSSERNLAKQKLINQLQSKQYCQLLTRAEAVYHKLRSVK